MDTCELVEEHSNKYAKMLEEVDNLCKAEGLIRFEVHNFSKIKDTVLSDPVMIGNLPW